MAGMLLSGSRPIYAAIYPFVVLAMILAASGFTALVSTLLIRSRAFTDAEQLLPRPGTIAARSKKSDRSALLRLRRPQHRVASLATPSHFEGCARLAVAITSATI